MPGPFRGMESGKGMTSHSQDGPQGPGKVQGNIGHGFPLYPLGNRQINGMERRQSHGPTAFSASAHRVALVHEGQASLLPQCAEDFCKTSYLCDRLFQEFAVTCQRPNCIGTSCLRKWPFKKRSLVSLVLQGMPKKASGVNCFWNQWDLALQQLKEVGAGRSQSQLSRPDKKGWLLLSNGSSWVKPEEGGRILPLL